MIFWDTADFFFGKTDLGRIRRNYNLVDEKPLAHFLLFPERINLDTLVSSESLKKRASDTIECLRVAFERSEQFKIRAPCRDRSNTICMFPNRGAFRTTMRCSKKHDATDVIDHDA